MKDFVDWRWEQPNGIMYGAILIGDVQEWLARHEVRYQFTVNKAWPAARLIFNDPDDEVLFKLRWM